MSWAVGYDDNHHRDIGYGVPAVCDHPGCTANIDRGLSYVCGDDLYGGEHGCGLFFCSSHLAYYRDEAGAWGPALCERCAKGEPCFDPKPDTAEWVEWKLTDASWADWRRENSEWVQQRLAALATPSAEGRG